MKRTTLFNLINCELVLPEHQRTFLELGDMREVPEEVGESAQVRSLRALPSTKPVAKPDFLKKVERTISHLPESYNAMSPEDRINLFKGLKIEINDHLLPAIEEVCNHKTGRQTLQHVPEFESWITSYLPTYSVDPSDPELRLKPAPELLSPDTEDIDLDQDPGSFFFQMVALELFAFVRKEGLRGFKRCANKACGHMFIWQRQDTQFCSDRCKVESMRRGVTPKRKGSSVTDRRRSSSSRRTSRTRPKR